MGDDSFKDGLKRRRKALDLTQAELAHKVGCSIYTIQKIEEGGARPSRQLAELLAAALAIPAEERAAFVQQARALGLRGPAPAAPGPSEHPGLAVSTNGGVATPLAPDGVNPYKGLRAFQEADAPDFFGREALTARLLERLGEDAPLARFLAVVGPSGAGKSSVVRAGLLPVLRQHGLPNDSRPVVVEFSPGAHPLEELAAALGRVAANPPPSLLEQLRADERGLMSAVQEVLPDDDGRELVLLIDQFEELFALVPDERVRAHFIDSIFSAVADERSRLWVVSTLRADFYDRPLLYLPASELFAWRTEVVGPLGADELYRAITGPAERYGVALADGLAATIMSDVAEQPGMLPLLEYALTELYERREGRQMTLAAYQASGGVAGALARRAEGVYEQLSAVEQHEARQLFLRLVTPGDGVEDTRRRVRVAELVSAARNTDALWQVLDRYGQFRMLTFDRAPGAPSAPGGPTVEVAHEALLRSWGRLRTWLAESREPLLVQRWLLFSAAEWQRSGQETSFLARGVRLAQFAALAAHEDGAAPLALTAEEQTYLAASLQEQQRQEAAAQAQQARERVLRERAAARLRYLLAGLVVFLVAAGGLAAWALNRSQVAQENFAHADALRLAAEANNLILAGGPSELAGLLSLRSLQMEYTAAGDAALEGATRLDYPVRRFVGLTSAVKITRFFPGGNVLLTADSSGLREWDVFTGRPLPAPDFGADHMQISSDGRRILGSSYAGTIRVWDTRAMTVTLAITEPLDPGGKMRLLMGAVYSPDERFILSWSRDTTARIWDAQTGRPVQVFHGPAPFAWASVWSPDGRYVLTGDADNVARLWDVQTGLPVRTFQTELPPGAAGGVQFLAYSPDGKTIAGSSWSTIQLWDAATGGLLRELRGHADFVNGATFLPDGKTLVTYSGDGTVRLWDVATGQQLRVLHGPHSPAHAAALTPDGQQAVVGYEDGSVLLWNLGGPAYPPMRGGGHLRTAIFSADDRLVLTGSDSGRQAGLFDAVSGRQLPPVFPGPQGSTVNSAAFSRDGKFLLTADGRPDNQAHLWDMQSGALVLTYPVGATVAQAIYAPDGKTVLTNDVNGSLRLWDAASAQLLRVMPQTEPGDDKWDVAFSPDGKYIAAANDFFNDDASASLWDVARGQELRRFVGHTDKVHGVAFSPDGKWLATGSADKTVRLWDVASGQELHRLVGHTDAVWWLAFSPDGKWLATASADTTARLWDVASGQELRRFSGHADTVHSVAFSHDGKLLLTGSSDGTARIWRTDYHDTMHYLCGMLIRDLTPDERTQYGITDPRPTCPTP